MCLFVLGGPVFCCCGRCACSIVCFCALIALVCCVFNRMCVIVFVMLLFCLRADIVSFVK